MTFFQADAMRNVSHPLRLCCNYEKECNEYLKFIGCNYTSNTDISFVNISLTVNKLVSIPVKYPPDGMCSGIIDTSFSNTMNSTIENTIADKMKSMPVWVSEECFLSYKIYLCSSYYISAYKLSMREVLVNNGITYNQISNYYKLTETEINRWQIYQPSYPDQSVCQDYLHSCSSYLAYAKRSLPDCSEIRSERVTSFLLVSKFKVNIYSPLNKFPNANSDFRTRCPKGRYIIHHNLVFMLIATNNFIFDRLGNPSE